MHNVEESKYMESVLHYVYIYIYTSKMECLICALVIPFY